MRITINKQIMIDTITNKDESDFLNHCGVMFSSNFIYEQHIDIDSFGMIESILFIIEDYCIGEVIITWRNGRFIVDVNETPSHF